MQKNNKQTKYTMKAIVKTDFNFPGQNNHYVGKVRDVYSIDGDYLVMTVREKSSAAHRAAVMAAWHKEQLTPVVEEYVRKWQNELDVKLATFEIRAMSAKWGTCSKAKGKAIFNVELAKKPLKCVEYVVAHELAHLIERTHNADFMKILDRHFPDWREIKDNLNRFPV